MKTKYLIAVLGLAVAAGGVSAGRAAWCAHRQLVSLDVQNAPLANVLRKIERQTWKKIRAEKALDARITLHVKNKPLSTVLDRICEQAGARWSTVFAVYGAVNGLRALEASLMGDGRLETAGWTKIAPKPPPEDVPEPDTDGLPFVQNAEGAPAEPLGYRPGPVRVRQMANGQMFVQAGNKTGLESWSPEELVVESRLEAGLGDLDIETASAATAAEAARKLRSKWTTCVALRKSVLGVGFVQPGRMGPNLDPMRRNPNDRFARLTPEQRVLQARQRLQFTDK